MSYLYAAYIIVWVVLIGYIGILTVGFKKVAEEMKELEK
jgi:hypothetical protein